MLKIFLPWALSFVFALFIYSKAENLLHNPKSDNQPSFNSESPFEVVAQPVAQEQKSPTVENTSDEWCDTESYEDLSNHPSILNFNQWLKSYITLNDEGKYGISDPRVKWNLLENGEKLAKERAPIFKRIIRNDPKKALELAVNEKIYDFLSPNITAHLEKWESTYTDFQAIHLCKDPKRPMGMIMQFASLPDGKRVEVHTYGKRKYLKTTKGVAIWGVRMGDDMAVSENPYRIQPLAGSNSFAFKMADIEFEIPSMQGVKALEKRIIEAERRGSAFGHVKYPLIASSTGSLNLIDLRYTLITNRLTWKEAQQVAFEKNATLVNINSSYENTVIYNLLSDAAAIGLFPLNESNDTVKYTWIGLSDSEDANGTRYLPDTNQTVFIPNISCD